MMIMNTIKLIKAILFPSLYFQKNFDPVTGMMASAGIGAVSSLLGGRAASKGAGASSAMYQQTRGDLMPWITAGQTSLEEQGRMMYDPTYAMQGTPGYDWRVSQGMKALDRTSAASGGLMSGGRLMALQDLGQRMASEEFGNRFSRLGSLSTMGATAAAQTGSIGAGYSQGTTAGEYRGAGLMGVGAALQQGLGQYSMYQGMQSGNVARTGQSPFISPAASSTDVFGFQPQSSTYDWMR